MPYEGWLTLAGIEAVNVARTTTLVRANLPTLDLRDCYACPDLAAALDDPPYPPAVDESAPWGDDPDLTGFYGFYPLSFTGVADSTYETTVTQSLLDGGTIAPGRRNTREMRMTGLLIASSAYALDAGMAWFTGALRGSQCSDGMSCAGDDLCFFAACPTDATADHYLRRLRDVVVTDGPTVLQVYRVDASNAHMYQVEFTLVAGTPWVYTDEVLLGSTMGTPASTVNLTVDFNAPALPSCVGITAAPPVKDPLATVLPSPPRPPVTGLPGSSLSYGSGFSILIPAEIIPVSNDLALVIRLRTGSQASRLARIRLYAAALAPEQSVRDLDACSFCAEVVISYIPPNATLILDGMNQTIYLELADGTKQSASHLTYATTAIGVGWPIVSCDVSYWLSVEFPGQETSQLIQGDSSDFAGSLGSWTGAWPGAPTATLEHSSTHVVSPSYSMLVHWPDQPATIQPQATLHQVSLVPGRFYEWSAQVYVPTGSPAVRLGLLGNPDGTMLMSEPSTVVDDWELLSITAAAPVSDPTVVIRAPGQTADGDLVWVDEVQCRDLATGSYSIVEVEVSTAYRT